MRTWEPDLLPGYWQQTVGLGPDPDGEGDLVTTLVRRGEPDPAHPAPAHAVLLVRSNSVASCVGVTTVRSHEARQALRHEDRYPQAQTRLRTCLLSSILNFSAQLFSAL